MTMTPRLVVPGFPHHIVNRGHNRHCVFAEPSDYEAYLADLIELKGSSAVKVHAYCLMTNHVHLLVTPETADGLALMMKPLSGRHTRRRNRREQRVGTLWQGRYRSSVVDRDRYLMICCRYIELNPVRAGMVTDPARYPWSSCNARLNGDLPVWLDPDPAFLAMGDTPETQRETYRRFLAEGIADSQRELVREAVQRGQLTGDPDFAQELEPKVGRVVERRGPGRPKRK